MLSNKDRNDLNGFQIEIHLWNEICSNYPDIYMEYSYDNYKVWHVTISKYNHNNGCYKFHFMVIWNDFSLHIPPKICLIFDQQMMVFSSNLFDNQYLILDKNINFFSATRVLLEMRAIVQRIELKNGVDSATFNQSCCGYCTFGQYNFSNNEINPYFIPNKDPNHTDIKPQKEFIGKNIISNNYDYIKEIKNEKEQREIIGEKLFPKIRQFEKEKCGKVLGLLLTELKIETLFKLLNNEELLENKIIETLDLLSKFKKSQIENNNQPKNVKPRKIIKQQQVSRIPPIINGTNKLMNKYLTSSICFSIDGHDNIHQTNINMNGDVYYVAIGKGGQFEWRKFEQESHH